METARKAMIECLEYGERHSRRIAFFRGNSFLGKTREHQSLFTIVDATVDGRLAAVYEGRHVLAPPSSRETLDSCEREMHISLPEEYREFLCRWNGGLLFLCEYYRLLSVEEVTRTNLRWWKSLPQWRGVHGSVVRFCDICDNSYLAFDTLNRWRVMWCGNEYLDQHYMEVEECGLVPEGDGFADWVVGIHARDGDPKNGVLKSDAYGYAYNARVL